jgi:hypothetical protein
MKKFLFWMMLGALLAGWSVAAVAQPDPLDSVILESKAVDPGTGNTADSTAYLYVRMWITNKDSLAGVTLAIHEKTVSGGAYAILARPRNFYGLLSPLTTTLQGQRIFGIAGYHSNPPDSFLLAGLLDPLDDATKEPPNAVRKPFWDIKFDTVLANNGIFELDTGRVVQNTVFTTTTPVDIPVNFVKSIITVGTVDVKDVNPGQRPVSYSLSQNYPNPFNANTQISFALPQSGKTRLEVFNILGQKVNTLVDEYMTAGYKTVNWDGRDFSGREVTSGVYFYRLRSEGFLQTKKMLFIK